MAALSANRLVCSAMAVITPTIPPISWERWPKVLITVAVLLSAVAMCSRGRDRLLRPQGRLSVRVSVGGRRRRVVGVVGAGGREEGRLGVGGRLGGMRLLGGREEGLDERLLLEERLRRTAVRLVGRLHRRSAAIEVGSNVLKRANEQEEEEDEWEAVSARSKGAVTTPLSGRTVAAAVPARPATHPLKQKQRQQRGGDKRCLPEQFSRWETHSAERTRGRP